MYTEIVLGNGVLKITDSPKAKPYLASSSRRSSIALDRQARNVVRDPRLVLRLSSGNFLQCLFLALTAKLIRFVTRRLSRTFVGGRLRSSDEIGTMQDSFTFDIRVLWLAQGVRSENDANDTTTERGLFIALRVIASNIPFSSPRSMGLFVLHIRWRSTIFSSSSGATFGGKNTNMVTKCAITDRARFWYNDWRSRRFVIAGRLGEILLARGDIFQRTSYDIAVLKRVVYRSRYFKRDDKPFRAPLGFFCFWYDVNEWMIHFSRVILSDLHISNSDINRSRNITMVKIII